MTSTYIGFDFDGCLAEAYTILPIVLLLEGFIKDEIRRSQTPVPKDVRDALSMYKERFYNRVALNEVATGGTLLRPSFLKVLPELLKQRQLGKIERLFIYSNNENVHLIDAVDHILALTLSKLKVPIPEAHLIKEQGTGRLQTFEPRIHRNAPCRSSERIQGDHYKEKTFQGIQTCLGKSIAESDLWFLDDTHDHVDLVNKLGLGRRYIETKKYEVKLKNPKLAELIVLSFPKECFDRATPIGAVFMKAYARVESIFIQTPKNEQYLLKDDPRFNPKGTDDEKKRAELLSTSLKAISPNASGNFKAAWTAKETETDTDKLRKALEIDYNRPRKQEAPIETLATATAYGETMEGGQRNRRRYKHTRKHTRRAIIRKRTRKVRGAK